MQGVDPGSMDSGIELRKTYQPSKLGVASVLQNSVWATKKDVR